MVGAVLLTFWGVLFYTTKSTPAFLALVLTGALVCSLLVLEQIVYTHREQVQISLQSVTDALEANDKERVLSHLAPTADKIRQLVEKLLPKLDIRKANIMGEVEVTLDDEKNPTQATAKFRGFFHAKHQSGMAGGKPVAVEVDLVRVLLKVPQKEDEEIEVARWLIQDFRSDDFEQRASQWMK